MAENFWHDKRFIVTGGAGFLGSFVIEKLKQRGATAERIFIPRIENYNLVDPNDIRRLYADTLKDVDPKNVIIIHLAANVGGIGANREHPAEFFYQNLMMGVELMHQAYKNGIGKFVAHLRIHRIFGYTYITGVAIAGGSAFYLAFHADPPVSGIPLFAMALLPCARAV